MSFPYNGQHPFHFNTVRPSFAPNICPPSVVSTTNEVQDNESAQKIVEDMHLFQFNKMPPSFAPNVCPPPVSQTRAMIQTPPVIQPPPVLTSANQVQGDDFALKIVEDMFDRKCEKIRELVLESAVSALQSTVKTDWKSIKEVLEFLNVSIGASQDTLKTLVANSLCHDAELRSLREEHQQFQKKFYDEMCQLKGMMLPNPESTKVEVKSYVPAPSCFPSQVEPEKIRTGVVHPISSHGSASHDTDTIDSGASEDEPDNSAVNDADLCALEDQLLRKTLNAKKNAKVPMISDDEADSMEDDNIPTSSRGRKRGSRNITQSKQELKEEILRLKRQAYPKAALTLRQQAIQIMSQCRVDVMTKRCILSYMACLEPEPSDIAAGFVQPLTKVENADLLINLINEEIKNVDVRTSLLALLHENLM